MLIDGAQGVFGVQRAATGITPEPRADHAQYLNSWLKVLRDQKTAIFTAFSKAQAAADFILDEPPEPARPAMRRAPPAEPDAPAGMK